MRALWFGFLLAICFAFGAAWTSGETQRTLLVVTLCTTIAVMLTAAILWYEDYNAAKARDEAKAYEEARERRLRQIDIDNLNRGEA